MTDRQLFINAFQEADELEIQKYKVKENFHHSFSNDFEKKMNKLIKKEKHISLKTRKRISKSLIAALIAIIVLLTGLMSVSASRRKIIEFVENIFPKYTQIKLSDDSPETQGTIETVYTLGYVPEGFIQKQYEHDDTGVFAVWQNAKGEEIVFTQDILNGDFSIDSEHDEYKKIELNGYPAYLYSDNTTSCILFTDGEYWFEIHIPESYKDELITLAENISEKN